MHTLILAALIAMGCDNCPPNGIIHTNTVIQTIGINEIASVTMSDRVLLVNAIAPSNQVNAGSSAIGTNSTPSH